MSQARLQSRWPNWLHGARCYNTFDFYVGPDLYVIRLQDNTGIRLVNGAGDDIKQATVMARKVTVLRENTAACTPRARW